MTSTISSLNQEKVLDNNHQKNNRWITVNGKRFHHIWLYDNCWCPKCRHPTSFQKINDISNFSSIPEPLSVVEEDGKLTITWKEKPVHQSVFPISWLMDYAYDRDAGSDNLHQKLELHKNQEILWDRSWIEANPPQKYDINADDFDSWTDQILTLGFAILHIKDHQDLLSLLSDIGPLYKMEGGKEVFTVRSTPGATDLSETGYSLKPHMDYECWRDGPPLLEVIYCAKNEVNGGKSLLVDGFKVAKDFRQNHPKYFNLLATTPVQFQQIYTDWQYYYRRSRSLLELDRKGEVQGVYFGHSHAYNWDLPFEIMEDYYEAYCAFYNYLKNPDYQHCFRLQPGDCIVTKNFRVCHGRKAFDANSGAREMRTSYMSWDYFLARENFKLFKDLYLKES